MEKIKFTPEGETKEAEFFVLEQVKLAGETYILVTEEEEGDADCWILKEIPGNETGVNFYETVTDDGVLQAVTALFSQLLEDVEIEV